MILSPTDYRRSSKKNNVWLPFFFLLIVFIFIFSNSYAGPDKFQVPVQDTIPAKRITGRVLNLEDSTPLTGASVVNLRTGHGTTTTSTGLFLLKQNQVIVSVFHLQVKLHRPLHLWDKLR